MAALSGNMEVVNALVTEHKADLHARLGGTHQTVGLDAGCTPLHVVAAFCTTRHEAMVTLLLKLGADINCRSAAGVTPLCAATIFQVGVQPFPNPFLPGV